MTNESKKFLTISEFANAIGVHEQTLRKWDKDGKLKPNHKTPNGRRAYTQQQVDDYFNGSFKTN